MDKKAYLTLEYNKIISRLADYASFSASAELARRLQPQSDLQDVRDRQSATREARHILSLNLDLPFHNAHDIRPQIGVARREGVLEPGDLLEIKNTLIVARSARRVLETLVEETPMLSSLA